MKSSKHYWWIAFRFEIRNELERREKRKQWEYKPNFRMNEDRINKTENH